MIKEDIIAWFSQQSGVSEEEILQNANENYFDLGYIDSFAFIELLSLLEDKGYTFSNEQFENRKFATIAGLIAILEGK